MKFNIVHWFSQQTGFLRILLGLILQTFVVAEAEGEERKLLVSGSLIDVSCLIHRLISFVQTLCQSLCALPDVDRSATTEADVEMLRALIQGRKDLLRSLLQVSVFFTVRNRDVFSRIHFLS